MANEAPQTYNDDLVNEISREVYFKAMVRARAVLNQVTINPVDLQSIEAYASIAEAAANGFKDEEESAYN